MRLILLIALPVLLAGAVDSLLWRYATTTAKHLQSTRSNQTSEGSKGSVHLESKFLHNGKTVKFIPRQPKMTSPPYQEKKRNTTIMKSTRQPKLHYVKVKTKQIPKLGKRKVQDKMKKLLKAPKPIRGQNLEMIHYIEDRKELDAVLQFDKPPKVIPRHQPDIKSLFYDDVEQDALAILRKVHKSLNLHKAPSNSETVLLRLLHVFQKAFEEQKSAVPKEKKKVESGTSLKRPKLHKLVSYKKSESDTNQHQKKRYGPIIHIHKHNGKVKIVKHEKPNSSRQATTVPFYRLSSVSSKGIQFH